MFFLLNLKDFKLFFSFFSLSSLFLSPIIYLLDSLISKVILFLFGLYFCLVFRLNNFSDLSLNILTLSFGTLNLLLSLSCDFSFRILFTQLCNFYVVLLSSLLFFAEISHLFSLLLLFKHMNIFIITALNFLLLIPKARPSYNTFLFLAFYHWVIFSFFSGI